MKKYIIATIAGLSMCSCVTQTQMMDDQARLDFQVCTGACIISSSIREDASREEAFVRASKIIDDILTENPVTRAELEEALTTALDVVFSEELTQQVVKDIMAAYDEQLSKIHANPDLVELLVNTKAAIESGINIVDTTYRPVKVVATK